MLGQIAAGGETSLESSPSLGPWRLASTVSVHEKNPGPAARAIFRGAAARVRSGWLHFTPARASAHRAFHANNGFPPSVTADTRGSTAMMCRKSGPERGGLP